MGRQHEPILYGSRFGRLTVQERVESGPRGHVFYRCVCECGATGEFQATLLRAGKTQSCGCLAKELASKRAKITSRKHGHYGNPLYHIWVSMMNRCYSPNSPAFSRYGDRGVQVCDRWHEVGNFIADMGDRPVSGYSLDRINNDGPYSPENCRWATRKEQARNRPSRNVYLTCDGRTQLLVEWAEELGISMSALHARLKHGWSHERTLKTPLRKGSWFRGSRKKAGTEKPSH